MTEFEDACVMIKSRITQNIFDIKELKSAVQLDAPPGSGLSYKRDSFDKEEMIENLIITYRKLEDARMRLDQAALAYNTGGWD